MIDSPKPKTPLISASSTLSTSSWRTIRQRDAPSETRTLISRERCAARASSRLATFAQAISSTNADRAHQRQEDQADWAAVLALVERSRRGPEILVGVGIVVRQRARRST